MGAVVWSAGWNTPGYSPNPDVVATFETWEEAHGYIVDSYERAWDESTDEDFLDGHTALHVVTAGEPYSVNSEEDSLGTAWWVQRIERAPEDLPQHHYVVYGVENSDGTIEWTVDYGTTEAHFDRGNVWDPMTENWTDFDRASGTPDEERDDRISLDLDARLGKGGDNHV